MSSHSDGFDAGADGAFEVFGRVIGDVDDVHKGGAES